MPNETIIQAKDASHRIQFTPRDWKVLFGPSFKGGVKLLASLGFNSFQPVHVKRDVLLRDSQYVLNVVLRDLELLRYDYTYHFSGNEINPAWGGSGGFCGFKIDGKDKCIFAEPGHCYICQTAPQQEEQTKWGDYLDLRNRVPVRTDNWGVVTVRRRNKGLCWLSELPSLIQFLERISDETLVVSNQHK